MKSRSGLTILEVLIILIVIIVLFILVMPSFMFQPRGAAIKTRCLSNVKQISTALVMYQMDYDDYLPPGNTWMVDSWPYVKRYDTYQCPEVKKTGGGYGYALNDTYTGRKLTKEPNMEKKVMVFESGNIKFNAHDPMASLPKPGRHDGSNIIGFLDGHAKSYKDGKPIP